MLSRKGMPSLFPTSPTIYPTLRGATSSPPLMGLGPSMRSLSDAPTEKKRCSLLHSGNTSLSQCPLDWPTPGHLLPPRRKSSTTSTLLGSPLLPGRHGCPFRGCMESLACYRQSPDSFPRCQSPNPLGKAQLFWDHIKYLGHEISAQGISIPPDYTSVIKDWPIPDTLKTLRAFLGKCGYYQRFITDYATISARLIKYTQQDQHEGILTLTSRRPCCPSLPHYEAKVYVRYHPGLSPVLLSLNSIQIYSGTP